MRTFSGQLTKLGKSQIFVFGSNTFGHHGKGAALVARRYFGAIYGQQEGRQGQSYGIVTKNLKSKKPLRSIPLKRISSQIDKLIAYANTHPDLEFFITEFGSSLAGYEAEEIAGLFTGKSIPNNFIMNKHYADIINNNLTGLI